MENYIIAGLIFIIILILIRKNTSGYTTADTPSPITNFYATYQNIGYDVEKIGGAAVTFPSTQAGNTANMVLADAAEFTWSREKVNYQLYLNNGVTANGTTYSLPNVWGFRKQLQVGGGGSLWYLVSLSSADISNFTGAPGNALVLTQSIAEITVAGTLYEIPGFVIIQKSPVTAVLQCDSNATLTTAQADDGSGGVCGCNAGYYGTGYDLSHVTGTAPAQAGCIITPVGYYAAAGATTATQCPADSVRGGSYYQTTAQTGSLAQSACFNPCSVGNSTQSGGNTTTAATCTCNAGTYTTTAGASCVACPAGTANPNATNISACPACGLGTYQTNTGQTTCTNCPAGKDTATTGNATNACTRCAGGMYSTGGGGACQSCPSGQTAKPDNTGCGGIATSTALIDFAGWPSGGSMVFAFGSTPPGTVYGTATLSGVVWTWYPPAARTYTFAIMGGAGGGGSAANGGRQVQMTTTYTVTDTSKPFYIVVGGGGAGGSGGGAGGGGGASFVFTYVAGTIGDWAIGGGSAGGGGVSSASGGGGSNAGGVNTTTLGSGAGSGSAASGVSGGNGGGGSGITPASAFAGGVGVNGGGNGGVGGGGAGGANGTNNIGGGGGGVTGGVTGSNASIPYKGMPGTSGCSITGFTTPSFTITTWYTPWANTGGGGPLNTAGVNGQITIS